MIVPDIRNLNKYVISLLLIALLIAVSWPSLSNYLRFEFSLNFLWILLLPFILYVKHPNKISYRYAWVVASTVVVYFIVPSYFFLYLLLWFSVFLVIEIRHGKMNSLAPFVVIATTPVFKYFFDLFGIPIRRILTNASAKLIGIFEPGTIAEGNSIWYQGNLFDVDPACAGLKLAITSVLIAMFFITYCEKAHQKELHFGRFVIVGLLSLILIGCANLFRIILLTVTGIGPENAWHDLLGMLCMILFTVLPMYFAIQRLYRTATPIKHNVEPLRRTNFNLLPYIFFIPFVLLTYLNHFHKKSPDQKPDTQLQNMQVNGYNKEILPNNTVSFTNDYSILYIKPSKGIFRSEHHPSFCWRGSGFAFKEEETLEISGEYVNLSRLIKNDESLWTAWWYDNGHTRTESQIQWRLDMLTGAAPYKLFNVTAADKDALTHQIRYIKDQKLLRQQSLSASK